MDQAPELVAVGNALVDVVAAAEEDIAPLFGLRPGEAVHVDFARFSEILVALPDPVLSAGGGSANVAKIASLLGLRTAFVGRLGSDARGRSDRFAELFEKELREAGCLPVLARGREPSGGCIVLRSPGKPPTVVGCPSAAAGLSPDDLPEDLIKGAQVMALDGYQLHREDLIERSVSLADRHGTVVALDAGSAAIAAERAATIARYARDYPVILFMNEAEAAAFSAAVAPAVADVSETEDEEERYRELRDLARSGPFPIVVVKRGPRGALVYANGDRYEALTRATVPFDETGAGDAFEAAFLAAWIRGKPLSDCAALGNKAALQAIAVPGTRLDPGKLRRLGRALR